MGIAAEEATSSSFLSSLKRLEKLARCAKARTRLLVSKLEIMHTALSPTYSCSSCGLLGIIIDQGASLELRTRYSLSSASIQNIELHETDYDSRH